MDHTFLDDESNLPTRTQEIVHLLQEKEKLFVVASGRALTNLEHKFKEIDHNLSFISDNGAILKHKGEIIYTNPIKPEHIETLIHLTRTFKESTTIAIGLEKAYIENVRDDHMAILKEYYNELEIVDDLMKHTKNIVKLTTLSISHSHDNYQNFVLGKLHEDLYGVESGAQWIDITNNDVNKGVALKHLMDLYQLKQDEVVTFGDYYNDLELIKNVKYGYVVENGAEGLKKHAYKVIGRNTDDAVINKILEHL